MHKPSGYVGLFFDALIPLADNCNQILYNYNRLKVDSLKTFHINPRQFNHESVKIQ